jgi:hypothetical protein
MEIRGGLGSLARSLDAGRCFYVAVSEIIGDDRAAAEMDIGFQRQARFIRNPDAGIGGFPVRRAYASQ